MYRGGGECIRMGERIGTEGIYRGRGEICRERGGVWGQRGCIGAGGTYGGGGTSRDGGQRVGSGDVWGWVGLIGSGGPKRAGKRGNVAANAGSVRGPREEKVHRRGGKKRGCGASVCGRGGRAWARRRNARAVRETGENGEGNGRTRVNGDRHGGSAHGGAGYAQRRGYPPPFLN